MSDLQISLLAIGLIVVLAVYLYGAWQHRRYRNRFGAAFDARHDDALYQGASTGGRTARAGAEDVPEPNAHLGATAEYPFSEVPVSSVEPEDSCQTLDATTDYIAVLFAASSLSARVLAPIWSRRFDFGANFHVCGVRAGGGTWEKVLPESRHAYDTFRLALQLADRSGPVSRARLEDFRDMLRDMAEALQAEVNLPDVEEAVRGAERLDAFCAEVDHMIGLNILPSGGNLLTGGDIAQVAGRHGMVLRTDGAFHLLDSGGNTLFTLANFDEAPFLPHELDTLPIIGLSLQLDVPRVEQPVRRFEEMVGLARRLGEDLQADVVDDNRTALGDAGVAMIRGRVAAIEKKMMAYPLTPGSALARRLFS